MFDIKSAYWATPLNNRNKKGIPNIGSLTRERLYKFTCDNKIPYHIIVEEYGDEFQFIKFYPASKKRDKDRFKIRTNSQKDFSKIVATCIKVCTILLEENPEKVIGFFGQWDDKDIARKDVITQRYRIYERLTISKFNKKNYNFITIDESLNLLLVTSRNDRKRSDEKDRDYISKRLTELFPPEKYHEIINPLIYN
ncbi:MAG: hypothetical protein WDZ35_01895 [Crocinitomicaceae bacterium]